MKNTRSVRWLLKVTTALGLVLATAGCAGRGDFVAASKLKAGSSEQTKRAGLLMRYCEKMYRAGDLYVAASMCQRAFDTDPSDPTPLYPLAEIYKELGAIQQAANAYRAAILINPDDFEALYGLAKTSIEMGQYEVAAAQLERALQLDDDDPRVYNTLGIVKDQIGEHDLAQALYRTGLLIDSNNVSLRNNLGLSLALTGRQAESVAMLREVASEPEAGTVGSQNLALAATYRAPTESIEIRPAGPNVDDYAGEEYMEGDQMGAAMSKPLHKQRTPGANGMPNRANGTGPVNVTPDSHQIGMSGEESVGPDEQDAGALQSAATRMLNKFFGGGDSSGDQSSGTAQNPAKSKAGGSAKKPSAEKQAAKTSKKSSTSKAGAGYSVQLGAFKSRKGADQSWKTIMQSAKDLLGDLTQEVVEPGAGGSTSLYRLRVGPLPNRAASDELCAKLSKRGIGCFVVKPS